MHFALVDNTRQAAAPGLAGNCPGCGQPVVAKCGTRRIWHWAHRGVRMCDQWWEPETDWHRAWKEHFDREWQEVIQFDPATGEKHIADVRTANGLVVEFQHSALHPDERKAREAFHGNMVWVVDGTRLKRDFPRFVASMHSLRRTSHDSVFLHYWPDECFPEPWLTSTVPVFFDFKVAESDDWRRDTLWCLFPGRAENNAVIGRLNREAFVAAALRQERILAADEIVQRLDAQMRESRLIAELREREIQRGYAANRARAYGRRQRRF